MYTSFLQKTADKHGEHILLTCILLAGFFLRFHHLGYQSLWLDEIYSAIESDPAMRDHNLSYYLQYVDQQPPLFFFLERISIFLFGNNETSLRLMPALAGTGSIWAIYLLGKEFYNKKLGLYAAAILAINSFCIYYAQEARPYSLALLLSLLSWVFFLKFIKAPGGRSVLLYAGSALFMLYANYFGMLVFAAQMLLAVIFWIREPRKKRFFWLMLLAGTIIGAGFAPLLPFLKTISGIKSFWATMPGEDVAIDYFYGYFDHSDLLKPLLLLLLISFFTHLMMSLREEPAAIRKKPLVFIFTACSIWIFTCFFVPYLRSLLTVPMLVPRYTIMAVPAFILLLAGGIEAIRSATVKLILLSIFCILSLTHLLIVKNYYNEISKTQFRELAKYMSADTALMFPVVTARTGWHQRYYLRKFHYRAPALEGDLALQLDTVLHLGKHPFWLTGAHKQLMPDKKIYQSLDSSYLLLKETHLYECWGQLFVPKIFFGPGSIVIDAKSYPERERFIADDIEQYIPMWNQRMGIAPVSLKAGAYQYRIIAKGTPVDKVYPHMNCYMNGRELGSYYLSEYREMNTYEFGLQADTTATFSFTLDNDAYDLEKSEDRNVFIHSLIITPKK